MKTLFAVLSFFRLIDENGVLSLTNLAVIAATVMIFRHPEMGLGDMAAFLGAITSYQAKRWMVPAASPADTTDELRTMIESLQTKVSGLQLSSQIRK